MSTPPIFQASHVTIRVADLDRAEAFYAGVLGFSTARRGKPDSAFSKILGSPPDAEISMAAMTNGDFHIELVQAGGERDSAPAAQAGLRHLGLRVADLDAAIAAIEGGGGRLDAASRLSTDSGRFAICLDPEGVRLLLMERAA